MDKNFLIGTQVTIGKNVRIGQFVTIGIEKGELKTTLGSHSQIRSHTVLYGGNTIGDHFETGHGVLIREANTIGNKVSVGSHTVIEHHVRIGNNIRIHSNSFIPEYSILEDNCWIGPHVVLTNAKYPRSPSAKAELKGPHIKRGAKIGANATILPLVVIGREALVGAGAVVTKDVPDRAVVVGNPATVINTLDNLPYV